MLFRSPRYLISRRGLASRVSPSSPVSFPSRAGAGQAERPHLAVKVSARLSQARIHPCARGRPRCGGLWGAEHTQQRQLGSENPSLVLPGADLKGSACSARRGRPQGCGFCSQALQCRGEKGLSWRWCLCNPAGNSQREPGVG